MDWYKSKLRRLFGSRIFKIIGGSLLSSVVIHFIFPPLIELSLNQYLQHNNTVRGVVQHVAVGWIHPELVLSGVYLKFLNVEPAPFLSVRSFALHFKWASLFDGHFFITTYAIQPSLYVLATVKKTTAPLLATEAWRKVQKLFSSLPISEITVNNGLVMYIDETKQHPYALYANNINGQVTNLRTRPDSAHPLPSMLFLHGNTMGTGTFNLKVNFNLKAPTPAFKTSLELEHLQLKTLNPLFRNYTDLQVKQGEFHLYMAAQARHHQIEGYAKPFFKNLRVTLPPSQQHHPLKWLFKKIVNGLSALFSNRHSRMVASKLPIKGSIDHPHTQLSTGLKHLFKNAFWEAIPPKLESS